MLLTDNKILIDAAKKNYDAFPVPTCLIESDKATMHYTPEDQAGLDIRTSKNLIGNIINLSQELNSLLWDMVNNGASLYSTEIRDLYCDICKLSCMSGLEIDKAKKILPVDNGAELRKMSEKYKIHDADGKKIRPKFFAPIGKAKGYYDPQHINYKSFETTMDYIQTVIKEAKVRAKKTTSLPLSSITEGVVQYKDVRYNQVYRIISLAREYKLRVNQLYADDNLTPTNRHIMSEEIIQEGREFINGLIITDSTAYCLIKNIEDEKNSDVKGMLFSLLFGSAQSAFYRIINKNATGVQCLIESTDGDIEIHGFRFKHSHIGG